jgi:hypothetical protein
MVLDPDTHQGTLMRYEYPTQTLCITSATNIAKGFEWKKAPNCKKQEKLIRGQNT